MKAIIMPKLGFTMTESTIVQWLKQNGDAVQQGEPIAEITTDKVNMEVEAPESGILAGLKYKEGDTVSVTEVIAYVLKAGEALPKEEDGGRRTEDDGRLVRGSGVEMVNPVVATPVVATPVAMRMAQELGMDLAQIHGTGGGGKITREDVEAAVKNAELRIATVETSRSPSMSAGKVRATPSARRMAKDAGVDLASVRGSGPNDRVQGEDVAEVIKRQTACPERPNHVGTAEGSNVTTQAPAVVDPQLPISSLPSSIPYTGMRKTIGTRLTQSYQQLPHVTFDADADVTLTEQLRARANTGLKAGQSKIGLTAIVVKACAWALARHPMINSRLDLSAGQITLLSEINIGVAVALENGLVVPVIQQANHKGVQQIGAEIADLAARAKTNRLKPAELQGGTFSISNLGMFGVTRFTAIINPPETAILAVGAVRKQFVPDPQDQPMLRPLLGLRLSADHRVIDGAVAAQFLADVVRALEDPAQMML